MQGGDRHSPTIAGTGSGNTCTVNADHVDRRLDAAWADAERQFEASQTSPPKSPPHADENYLGDVSVMNGHGDDWRGGELLSSDSDVTLQVSNRASSAPLSIHTNYCQKTELLATNNQTLIHKYRVFLQKNQTSLDLIEHVMERFVFYGHLFKHDHTGIGTEMYYAAWNIIRWINDVVLKGWGEGIGMTFGTREDWFSPSTTCRYLGMGKESISDTIFLRLSSAVPLIRTILTATTCIYPAMEAWSRRSLHSRPSYGMSRMLHHDTTDQQGRQRDWEKSQCRAAQLSYRLERVRFVARLALLSFSWWAQYRRRCSTEKDGNERRRMLLLPPPLLKRGGELDPYEKLVPLQDAEEEAKVAQYVGRRTGRRSIPSSPSRSCASPYGSISSAILTLLSGLNNSKNRILYFYAVGELLHILRPLYWSHAESKRWQRRFSSGNVLHNQQAIIATSTFSSWKAWCISLLIDMISDKLLQINVDGDSTCHRKLLAKSSVGRHSHQRPPSVELAQLEELERRGSRHMLYLLRSPIYNAVTLPLATFVAKIVSKIPSFGFARWAAEYILDLMSYWTSNRFMLES